MLWRYAPPIAWMKVPAECETLLTALGLSLPPGEVDMITFTSGRIACSTS